MRITAPPRLLDLMIKRTPESSRLDLPLDWRLAIVFANAADPTTNNAKDRDEIKTNEDGRVLQEFGTYGTPKVSHRRCDLAL
jgi:hypothetical protein